MDGTGFQGSDGFPFGLAGGTDRTGRAAPSARLEAHGVSWGPKGRTRILSDATFAVSPGQILGILGPNGAGKSSLLRLIYGFYKPSSGKVLLDGRDVRSLKAGQLSRDMAVVLQEQPAEFSLTVKEIVGLGRLPHRRARGIGQDRNEFIVRQTLEGMGLLGFGDRLLGTLSGGERQRVAIARALAQQPRILVLDEPTNHLDIRHQLETMSLLRGLGLTVVCSLHDLNAAVDLADVVLLLSGGETLAFGPPESVLTPELISTAFAVNATADGLNVAGKRHFSFQL